MLHSMTGFASAQGERAGTSWTWELRGVNGKGLDLRLRIPDGIDGLEAAVRARLSAALGRGNVTVSLKLNRTETATELTVNTEHVNRITSAMAEIATMAQANGLTLSDASAVDILNQRGVWEAAEETEDEGMLPALLDSLDAALSSFIKARAGEGKELLTILTRQVDEVAALTASARETLGDREAAAKVNMEAALGRLQGRADGIEPDRLAQELALIAVKSDVSEELDRLSAHVAAARELLESDAPVGRKFDFLAQEFNREANTLCAKSGHPELTKIGLELKVVIDRLREQVQNVE